MSVIAIVVSVSVAIFSLYHSRYLQRKQHEFELLGKCFEELSEWNSYIERYVGAQILVNYPESDDKAHRLYAAAVEIYGRVKRHLDHPDTRELDDQIEKVATLQARLDGGERRLDPDGFLNPDEAITVEKASFVWLMKKAVATAVYGPVASR